MRKFKRISKQLVKLRNDYLRWNEKTKEHSPEETDQVVHAVWLLVYFIHRNHDKHNVDIRISNLK